MMKTKTARNKRTELGKSALKALRRAVRRARATARMHDLPVYVWRDGKVVAEKP
jgi:hypothetical protein